MTRLLLETFMLPKQRHSSAKLLNQEKNAILAMFTSDVTLPCIACRR